MKKVLFSIFVLLIFLLPKSYAQTLSAEEKALYNFIMKYRRENNLAPIRLSPSLTTVAQTHVKDLYENKPDKGECNPHSWSDKGKWTAVCYTGDHANAQGMWNKPKELSSYTGYGYEIAYWSSGSATPGGALKGWKGSPAHNSMIINQGIWKRYRWRAIGIGIFKNYAVVWFGQERDNN